jgi:hypothetical protein
MGGRASPWRAAESGARANHPMSAETKSGLSHRDAQSHTLHCTAVLINMRRLVPPVRSSARYIVYSRPTSRSQHRWKFPLTAAGPTRQERRVWVAGRAIGEQSTGSYPVLPARDTFATGSCLVLHYPAGIYQFHVLCSVPLHSSLISWLLHSTDPAHIAIAAMSTFDTSATCCLLVSEAVTIGRSRFGL